MIGILPMDSRAEKIDLNGDKEDLILCRAGWETVMECMPSHQKADFSHSLLVQNAETVVRMVKEGNGRGLISRFTLSSISHKLRICPVVPAIGTQIGLIALSLQDLTPVAQEFARMVRELCAKMK